MRDKLKGNITKEQIAPLVGLGILWSVATIGNETDITSILLLVLLSILIIPWE
jgi:hypothetical protein